MTKRRIYLDNHATTPVDPRVLEAMLPYFNERFGNPASKSHPFGWEAQNAVDQALGQVAALIGASENEIVFTSGATESINLALKGAAAAYRGKGRHIVTTTIEHRAVLDPCQLLADNGFEITRLDVDRDGILALDDLAAALREDTILVSIIHANNEIGVIQDIEAIGALCRGKGVLLHVDAAQSVGKIPVDVDGMQIDLLSISAHKYYGPKGIGALYV
ncbi:MAG: aminotransferase class V-fold PLP-dependent enzyme, partial [Candidatus Marinimicrobia bacterium]|nr:aminotransferase class V-fold PLP-dependent enzyme [Candidatus Neomarinimicrobiota bacterium]